MLSIQKKYQSEMKIKNEAMSKLEGLRHEL